MKKQGVASYQLNVFENGCVLSVWKCFALSTIPGKSNKQNSDKLSNYGCFGFLKVSEAEVLRLRYQLRPSNQVECLFMMNFWRTLVCLPSPQCTLMGDGVA